MSELYLNRICETWVVKRIYRSNIQVADMRT